MVNMIPVQLPVFEYKGQLVADSRDVAAEVERPHWQILRTINTMYKHLTDNKIVVSDYFIPATYIDPTGRELPCYYCTEMGCDMVANKQTGEKGSVFTARYVKAFHQVRSELTRRKELRTEGKPIRRSLTDALRDSGENDRMHGHAYAAYTNLAYKLATGKNARQLRKERGAERKAVAADVLTSEELESYQKQEYAIAALLDVGLDYSGIQDALCRQRT